ncbi:hypothetical protein EUTSA_v10001102mg [Eutrema salsugineum]|uniref:Serpin domain-containing protein n=1 Tax=Eutrema salsugineum TaxID=72664 RepID=V4L7S1_EUTSA|nr:hypothetical protein EUTSA_v10001102mg [Eutrema salsugineum]
MDQKKMDQKLLTSSDTTDDPSSLSKMDRKNKKKQKLNKSQEIIVESPTLAEIEVPKAIDERKAMKKQNDVALFLAGKVISAVAKNSNLVFSPASINAVLTMAAATSGYDDQSLSLDPSSKDLLVDFFKADFSQAEQVRMEVNEWASNHTNGLINNLLPPGSVTSLTKWIYGNALYFKGAWEHEFRKAVMRDRDFHLVSGTSVSVPFMSSYKDQYIKAYDGFKVLRLPYRQGHDGTNRKFSMYLYLPDKIDGFNNLLERMTSTNGFLDNHIPSYKVEVGKFRIPKFKIEFGFEASKVFDDLELEVLLYQKASIEIDEKCTKAFTFNAYVGSYLGAAPKPKKIDFVADHPFFFLIREDKTETVLFAGQIFNPSKSS